MPPPIEKNPFYFLNPVSKSGEDELGNEVGSMVLAVSIKPYLHPSVASPLTICSTTDRPHLEVTMSMLCHLNFFSISLCLSVVGTPAFLLAVHRLCGVIGGRLSHFFATLAQDGLAGCDQPGKNPLE